MSDSTESRNVTIAEEVLLLLLDEKKGTLIQVPQLTLHFVLAGAVLMELAIRNRVDNDLHSFFVINTDPTGEPVLDGVLAKISSAENNQDSKYWVNAIADEGGDLLENSINRLIERGILGRTEKKILWLVKTESYSTIDDTVERESKRRVLNLLYSDEIPDQEDIVLLCLLDASNMLRALIGQAELARLRPRIDQIIQLDLIGQATTKLIREIQVALVAAHAPLF
ncbi:MAG: GPP34 family phosphoprotein [Acidiferrobacterales bacterium]|nr:GPP34 family phosphoprotein [Acidiferrobacterales bacterium]